MVSQEEKKPRRTWFDHTEKEKKTAKMWEDAENRTA